MVRGFDLARSSGARALQGYTTASWGAFIEVAEACEGFVSLA
jgi:hypothetical protein